MRMRKMRVVAQVVIVIVLGVSMYHLMILGLLNQMMKTLMRKEMSL